MIDILSIFIADGAGILLMAMILISATRTKRMHMLDDRLFYAMAITVIVLCGLEAFTFYIDGLKIDGFYGISSVSNALLYILNMAFCLMWVSYLDFKMFSSAEHLKSFLKRIAWPAVIIIIASFVNMYIPVFFTITADNLYVRSDLFWIPYAVTYAYLIFSILQVQYTRKRIDRYLMMPVALFLLPIVIGSVIQFFCFGVSLVWLGASIAVTMLYVNIQNEANSIEPLSGLYSRTYLLKYLESVENRKGSRPKFVGLMLDIDEFKTINDTFGHKVGDDAIRQVGYLMRSALDRNSLASRYGGDEFLILKQTDSPFAEQTISENIIHETEKFNASDVAPYKLSLSIGAATFDPNNETVDEFLEELDKAMYKQKALRAVEHDRRKSTISSINAE